jgi:arsenate reductase-like glutaredoxin family protein
VLSQIDAHITERRYFTQRPTRGELEGLARLLPGGVRDLLSTRTSRLKELGVSPKDLSDEQIVDLLTKEPKLLRRPILTDGERIVVGLDRQAMADLARSQA